MIVLPDGWTATDLAVFNTLIPQGDPGNLRRFVISPVFRGRLARIFVDRDRDLGSPNRDEAFIPDPAQAVLVMELGERWEPHPLLVVQMRVLIEQKCSVRADSHIRWDEWRGDVVVMVVSTSGSILPTALVHGTQVAVVGWARHCYNVHTFDFAQRSSLSLRGGAGGTERWVAFEDGANFKFAGNGGWDQFQSLSDGSLFSLVSCHS